MSKSLNELMRFPEDDFSSTVRSYDYYSALMSDCLIKMSASSEEINENHKLFRKYQSYRRDRSIVLSNVDFALFGEVGCNHHLIEQDGNLVCLACGASTKEYEHTKYEYDFLKMCAEDQGLLLKNATEKDLSLYKVLVDEANLSKMLVGDIAPEERFLIDFAFVSTIDKEIDDAHWMDEGTKKYRFLNKVKANNIIADIKRKRTELENSTSRFKDLALEDLMVAEYEVMILSGLNINGIYQSLETENEKIAFVRAYYNVSSIIFRVNSDYFANDKEKAMSYRYRTANSEVNEKILELKKRG